MRLFAISASLLSLVPTMVAMSPVAADALAEHDGFYLPANLTNGIYTAYFDAAGKEIHTLISTDVPTGSPAPSLHERQSYPDNVVLMFTLCGCGLTMNVGDCNNAWSGLQNWAGDGQTMGINEVVYVISGSVVAFVCSNNGVAGQTYIAAIEIRYDGSVITDSCGSYVPGTVIQRDYNTYDIVALYTDGYMNYYSGMNICGAARYGTAESC